MNKLVSSRVRFLLMTGVWTFAGLILLTDRGRALTAPLRVAIRPVAGALASRAFFWRARMQNIDAIKRERDALREELVGMSALSRDVAVCREENNGLRSLAEYIPGAGYHTIAARLLSRLNAEGTRVLVDQGTRHGVTQGAAVVTEKGILIGRVATTDVEFSEIALLRDTSTHIPARVMERNVEGILRVGTQGALVLDLISAQIEVEEGDIVVTAGTDVRIPRDVYLGYVLHATQTHGSPFLLIDVSSSASSWLPSIVGIVVTD